MADDRGLSFGRRAFLAYEEINVNLGNVLEQLDTHELSEIEDYREPLSVEARKEVTVLLSWGGPSDGFKVYFDDEGEAVEGFYFFADWFEYDEFKLSDTQLDRVLSLYF